MGELHAEIEVRWKKPSRSISRQWDQRVERFTDQGKAMTLAAQLDADLFVEDVSVWRREVTEWRAVKDDPDA